MSLAPDSSELKLWFALGMMRQGEAKKGESMLRSAVGRGQDVKAILRELASRGIIGNLAERSLTLRKPDLTGEAEPTSPPFQT